MAAFTRLGAITTWREFLDALDDFESIVADHWDSDESHDIPSRFSTLGLNLADWIAKQSPHDPTPLLDLMRAVAAKDPLGPMAAFKASVEEVDRLRWRWWPIKELLVDQALAEIGGKPAAATAAPRAATVNQRMAETLLADQSCIHWSRYEWSVRLNCSESAVQCCATWEQIQTIRAAERFRTAKAKDRRRNGR